MPRHQPIEARTGQSPGRLLREASRARCLLRFHDPAFAAGKEAIDRLEAIAWGACREGHHVACAGVEAVKRVRDGTLAPPDAALKRPRPK